jgi:hypothetical protein
VVIALEKLVLTLLDRIGQTPRAPTFLVHDVSLAVGDESLDSFPSLRRLIGADHRAKNDYQFVVTQMFPLLRKVS